MIDITKQHIDFARAYICYRTTPMIDIDVKQFKKINTLLGKLERTEKDSYALEIINIIRTLSNVMDLNLIILAMYELIDFKYHPTMEYILLRIDSVDSVAVRKAFEVDETDVIFD